MFLLLLTFAIGIVNAMLVAVVWARHTRHIAAWPFIGALLCRTVASVTEHVVIPNVTSLSGMVTARAIIALTLPILSLMMLLFFTSIYAPQWLNRRRVLVAAAIYGALDVARVVDVLAQGASLAAAGRTLDDLPLQALSPSPVLAVVARVAFVPGVMVLLWALIRLPRERRSLVLVFAVNAAAVVLGARAARGPPGNMSVYFDIITTAVLSYLLLRRGVFETTKVAIDRALESMSDGVAVLSAEKQVLFSNGAMGRLLGIRTAQALPPYLSSGADLDQVARAPGGAEGEILMEVDARSIKLAPSHVLDSNGQLQGYLLFARDVTQVLAYEQERRRTEKALAARADELVRSNLELEQFAYVASHDLQEPLRTVAGFTQLLARRYQGRLDDKADEYIRFAVDGATRMQQLIQDLLAFSRMGTSGRALCPTDTAEVMRRVSSNLEKLVEESGAEVTCGTLPVAMGDTSQLVQLFQNLVSNGIKFHRPGVPPRVQVSAEQGPEGWRFSVRDNGIGIEPQYFDRIFVLFKRLHPGAEYAGTGIGLAVCKKIIDRHRGRIWVESTPGQGSTFFFTLPATD